MDQCSVDSRWMENAAWPCWGIKDSKGISTYWWKKSCTSWCGKCPPIYLQEKNENKNHHPLVGGFNPLEKYVSNWIISPGIRGEHNKYLSCHHPSPTEADASWHPNAPVTILQPFTNGQIHLAPLSTVKHWSLCRKICCRIPGNVHEQLMWKDWFLKQQNVIMFPFCWRDWTISKKNAKKKRISHMHGYSPTVKPEQKCVQSIQYWRSTVDPPNVWRL